MQSFVWVGLITMAKNGHLSDAADVAVYIFLGKKFLGRVLAANWSISVDQVLFLHYLEIVFLFPPKTE